MFAMKLFGLAPRVSAACLVLAAAASHAAYPEQPIQFMVPFAAGGGSDILARAVAKSMSGANKGMVFVIENRAGAGGNIATVAVAKAKPDGYTIILASPSTHGINPYLYKNVGYDPIKDFTVIGQIGQAAMVLFASASFPASTPAELVALVKKNPGKYTYGSPGSGTQHHLGMELLKFKAGLDLPHAPYKGAGPGMIDLAAGHIPLMIGGFGPAAGFLAQGKIKVIGSPDQTRLESAKDVPLFSEAVPGVSVGARIGLAAPAGTPADIIKVLSDALAKAMTDPELKKQLTAIGVDADYQPADVYARSIVAELPIWKQAVEVSGAKAE